MLSKTLGTIAKAFTEDPLKGYDVHAEPRLRGGHQNLWSIFDATDKATGTAVSVFSCFVDDVERRCQGSAPGVAKSVLERLKAGPVALTRVRHPGILQLVAPLHADARRLTFVTERVVATLGQLLREGCSPLIEHADECLLQLAACAGALHFLHTAQAPVALVALHPHGIFVTASRQWKPGDFAFAVPLPTPVSTGSTGAGSGVAPAAAAAAALGDLFRGNYLHPLLSPPLDYIAPEVLKGQPCAASDAFSFGCVLYEVAQGGGGGAGRVPFLNASGDTETYRRQLDDRHWQGAGGAAGPAAALPYLAAAPASRPPLAAAATFAAPLFDAPALRAVAAAEAIPTMDPTAKMAALRQLYAAMPALSEGSVVARVLPLVRCVLVDPRAERAMVPFLAEAAGRLSEAAYAQHVAPLLVPLLEGRGAPQAPETLQLLLESMPKCRRHLHAPPQRWPLYFAFLQRCLSSGHAGVLACAAPEVAAFAAVADQPTAWTESVVKPLAAAVAGGALDADGFAAALDALRAACGACCPTGLQGVAAGLTQGGWWRAALAAAGPRTAADALARAVFLDRPGGAALSADFVASQCLPALCPLLPLRDAALTAVVHALVDRCAAAPAAGPSGGTGSAPRSGAQSPVAPFQPVAPFAQLRADDRPFGGGGGGAAACGSGASAWNPPAQNSAAAQNGAPDDTSFFAGTSPRPALVGSRVPTEGSAAPSHTSAPRRQAAVPAPAVAAAPATATPAAEDSWGAWPSSAGVAGAPPASNVSVADVFGF